jgi:hypothetical protein
VCRDYTVERVETGQPCGPSDPQTLKACGPGFWCRTDRSTSSKTCSEPILLDQSCDAANDICVDNAICSSSPLSDAGNTCRGISVRRTVGESCQSPSVCDPIGNLACDNGACERVGDGTQGSACLLGPHADLGCGPDLACLVSTSADATMRGQCGPWLRSGVACRTSRDCASGQCDLDGTCAATKCRSHW